MLRSSLEAVVLTIDSLQEGLSDTLELLDMVVEEDDASGLEAHQQTDHFQELVLQRAIPLLESRVRRYFVDF